MVRNAAQDTNQGFRAPQAEKPSPEFFAKIVAESSYAPNEIAYVRDRLDNDIRPALAAGMLAVLVRRGPWGYIHAAHPDAALVGRQL
jgi:FMN phosphatase YigB (HAD superfamily)